MAVAVRDAVALRVGETPVVGVRVADETEVAVGVEIGDGVTDAVGVDVVGVV